MKKVLIADDELLVRIGLKSTINWEENGYVVVGEAKNGKECIKIFDKVDADILITDIKMPIINGLELIQILKKKKENLKSIILTHYDDFNYAKEAIKLGASDYILKSNLTNETLLEILNNLSIDIDKEKKYFHPEEVNYSGQTSDSVNYIENYLYEIFHGNNNMSVLNNIKNRNMLRFNNFLIIYSSIHKDESENFHCSDKNSTFRNTIYNISNNIFDNPHIDKYITIINDNIVFLLNFSKIDTEMEFLKKIYNLINTFKGNIIQFLNVEMYLGVSQVESEVDSIHELFRQSKIAHEKNFFDNNRITIYDETMNEDLKIDCKVSFQALKECLLTFNEDVLNKYINSIFDDLKKIKKINLVKNILGDFLSYGKILAEELNLRDLTVKKIDKFNYGNINKLKTFNNMKQYVIDLYSEMLHAKKYNNTHSYSYAIYKSLEFIEKNYKHNITLSDVAEHSQISKSYLSVLFKQETGINFSNYLIQYRIEKAKKLLLETNYKMYEIAELVGFVNPYYFSKVFKEITGYTCKHFRSFSNKNYKGTY